ncbi:hypothetical protein F4808DRAFT_452001 [Astrocystis sublimbata]|nr:hypothetical protein F4808DRAFT_452001 [Astrocystis sublimbata]
MVEKRTFKGLTLLGKLAKNKSPLRVPLKRSVSGSISLKKGSSNNASNNELDSILAPTSMDIDITETKKVINKFRSPYLNRAICYTISGNYEPYPRNGILLIKHPHEVFDVQLISIHPRTFRIRIYYIENIAVEKPSLDITSLNISKIAISAISTPFNTRYDLPAIPSSSSIQTKIVINKISDLS